MVKCIANLSKLIPCLHHATARSRFSMDIWAIITFQWQNEVTVYISKLDNFGPFIILHVIRKKMRKSMFIWEMYGDFKVTA